MSTADAAGWLNPDDADAYDNRGLALKEQGKETEAIADLRVQSLSAGSVWLGRPTRRGLKPHG